MLKLQKKHFLRRGLTFVLLVATFSVIAPIQSSTAAQDAECVIGSSNLCPATSPQEIYNIYGTTTDGTYWIKVGGTATQVVLKMNRTGSDNGAWILLMKGVKGTTNFDYADDTFASNTFTLNTSSLVDDVSTDAKFSAYNNLTLTKMLAVLRDPAAGTVGAFGDIQNNAFGGHVWLETLPSASTAYARLNSTLDLNSPANSLYTSVPKSKYFTSSIGTQVFSYQAGNGRYGFNGSPCNSTDYKYRWGIAWNQEADWASCDVIVGIGLAANSPGDQVRWAGVVNGSQPIGSNTGKGNMGFQIWGKVAEPSLGAPTSVAATVASSSQVNLSWSAPSGVTATDYVVQYKTSTNGYTVAGSKSFLVSGQTTASITGLSGGTTYNFRVFARTGTDSTANPASSTVSATLKSSQTLSFSTTSYSKAFGETQTVTATSLGSGLITYSAGASTACTISGSTVTITASTGTCTITASRAADDNYQAADSINSVSITVSKAVQATLILTSTSAVFLTNLRLLTNGGSGPGAVTYTVSSSGTAGCAVSNGDSLTSTSAGTCVVVATKATSTDYLAAYDTRTVTIGKASLTLTTSVSASLKYGETTTATYSSSRSLGVSPVPNLSGTLTYETSTSTACTINTSTGLVTMIRASGTCNVRITLSNDTNFSDTSSALVAITPAKADAISLTAANKSSTYTGSPSAITPTYSVSGLQFSDTVTVTYSYSGTANGGANYSLSGTKPTNAGVYSIVPTVTLTNSDSYTAPSANVTNGTLTIERATRTLSATNYSSNSLKYGDTATVTSNTTSPSSNSDGTFLYTVGSGCSVNSSTGQITATTYSGTCLETTTVTQGNNYETATATAVTFTLSKADTITVTTATPSALTYTGSSAVVTPTVTVSGLVAGNTATGATFNFSRAPTCAQGGVCQVGDTGPGGGKVFHVSGSAINAATGVSKGGIYLEMAPASFSKTLYNWCEGPSNPYTTLIGASGTAIGMGANNTKIMIQNCNGGAGFEAASLNYGGQTDWFLPSFDELQEIYNLRNSLGLGASDAASGYLYWSSTESSDWIAASLVPWAGVGGQNKGQATPYLPIRAFSATVSTYSASVTPPTNAGSYVITPSALTLAGGITTDYYKATVYETATLTINKATQAAFTSYQTLSGIFGTAFNIYKFGGSGDGEETVTVTNGTATGCVLNGTALTVATAGTCVITATKATSENHLEATSTFTVILYFFVAETTAPVSSTPTQIAVAISNGVTINPIIGPFITGISPSSGPVGTTVTITGTGMTGVDVIKIGRRNLTSVTVIDATTVTGVIPAGATTGPIFVSNSAGSDFNPGGFTVTTP
jgi:hypothetical protein